MSKPIPLVHDTLLMDRQGEHEQTLIVGTSEWYAWLAQAETFAFTSPSGTFTARKEQAGNRRGGWYWKAYRKAGGKLSSAYLGKSESLTIERLRTVATKLAGEARRKSAVHVEDDSSLGAPLSMPMLSTQPDQTPHRERIPPRNFAHHPETTNHKCQRRETHEEHLPFVITNDNGWGLLFL